MLQTILIVAFLTVVFVLNAVGLIQWCRYLLKKQETLADIKLNAEKVHQELLTEKIRLHKLYTELSEIVNSLPAANSTTGNSTTPKDDYKISARSFGQTVEKLED